MSLQHAQLVSAMLADFSRGDMDAVKAAYHPDFVVQPPEGVPYSGARRGVNDFMVFLGELNSMLSLDLGEQLVIDAGEKVVVQLLMTFTGRESERSCTQRTVEVYEFRDGLISYIDIYYKDPAAVRSLLEQADSLAGAEA